ncbi:hypothetical protein GHK92_17375 [Nocardioides sp. dk4132]|uniref:hypothetical protein n=1 Tax=unclassified Nocardioides TaxID=2615069 RepID=UPI001297F6C4|nr:MULTISPECIES: hypothetical protein [unclassified Nocardioides]MQW77646.1 hypothetical protein [Nocardioides sp. dk4132]
MDEDEERLGRPDGHRYAAPEPESERESREWVYVLLALVVVGLMVLIVTGVVPVHPGG